MIKALWLEGGQVLFWVAVPLLLSGLYGLAVGPALFKGFQVALFGLNVAAGFLAGAQFPVANRLWLEGAASQGGQEGALYASDLAGAFLGSVLVSVVLVPVLGVVATCLLAAVIKVCSLGLFVVLGSRAA